LVGLAIVLGLSVDALASVDLSPIALAAADDHGTSLLEAGALVVLAGVLALSVLRQGPRVFVGQVLSPYAPAAVRHEHASNHVHDHHQHGHDLPDPGDPGVPGQG